MTEEPYRWMEAIANRREYIEHQISGGSPITALTYAGGILLFTMSRERQKLFEIYDRIALGAIGHPGDIERLRMAAIELASTEGFTRSSQDVSLRRLASYSLSPALKAAFEQIYGPPYLARLLFAELGRGSAPNLFVRMEYDGSFHTNGGSFGRTFEDYGAISGTSAATVLMEQFLRENRKPDASFEDAIQSAAAAWAVGHLAQREVDLTELPSSEAIRAELTEQLANSAVETAVLGHAAHSPVTWRSIPESEVRPLLQSR
jgi:proteasome alpha subunit